MQLTCFTLPKIIQIQLNNLQSTSLSLKSLHSHSRKSYLIIKSICLIWVCISHTKRIYMEQTKIKCRQFIIDVTARNIAQKLLIELFVAIFSFISHSFNQFSHTEHRLQQKNILFLILSYLIIIKIFWYCFHFTYWPVDDRYVIVLTAKKNFMKYNINLFFIKEILLCYVSKRLIFIINIFFCK